MRSVRKIDRNGRVIDFTYDSLSRTTAEAWYDDETDADVEQNVRKIYSTTYDEAGRVASIGDGANDFAYTHSVLGQLTSSTQELAGLSDELVFTYAFDVLGRVTQVAARVGATDDYVNRYAYDALGRVTQITQAGVDGGNDVAEKRVDFGVSDDGTRATLARFSDLAGTKAVAETDQVFDRLGRVAGITHERASTAFADYAFNWDAAGRLTGFDFTSLVGDDGDGDYAYDDTSQLTGADYDFQTDESYTYDDNGNRTNAGHATGDHNRLTADGTYTYAYDNEGNVTSKTNASTSESVQYTWDQRNRLTKVTFRNASNVATKIVEYAYDHGQRWIRKTLDTNADGTIEESRVFVHDAGQIVLDFHKTGTGDAANADLAHRILWGTAVDQILADESVDDGTADDVAWTLTDHLNSVRDWAAYDPVTDTASVIKHVTYDAFGKVTSDSASAVGSLFLFTARPYDADGQLQNNLNRWYDLATGRWMSQDPIGFEAGDGNCYRYIGNAPLGFIDPLGSLGFSIINVKEKQSGLITTWLAEGPIDHQFDHKWDLILTIEGSNCEGSASKVICGSVSLTKGTTWIRPLAITQTNGAPHNIAEWGKDIIRKAIQPYFDSSSNSTPWHYGTCVTIPPCSRIEKTVYRRVETHGVIGTVSLWVIAVGSWPGAGRGPDRDSRGALSVFGVWRVDTANVSERSNVSACRD